MEKFTFENKTEIELMGRIIDLLADSRAHHEDAKIGAPIYRVTSDEAIKRLMGDIVVNKFLEDSDKQKYIRWCTDALEVPSVGAFVNEFEDLS